MEYERFILVDEQGDQPVLEGFAISEEDDDRDLLISTTVNGRTPRAFFESIAEWLNCEVADVQGMIKGDKLITDDGIWTIKKELITERPIVYYEMRQLAGETD